MNRTKKKCKKCGRNISLSNFKRHLNSCSNENKNSSSNKIDEYEKIGNKYKCPYCNNLYKKHGICTHVWRMHTKEGEKFNPAKGFKTGDRVVWNKGLTKEEHPSIMKASKKLKGKYIGKKHPCYGKSLTEEHKEAISKGMKIAVKENPNSYSVSNVSGRVKNIEYKNTIVKGSWELETAKYLDSLKIKWTNDLKPFTYIWKNNEHSYFPDFYLIDYDYYIEVKGFKRKRDEAKWAVVDNLIVLRKNDIKKIKRGTFNLLSYFK